ncbi:hypothetical protein LXA43DRAFT_1104889 [Ganoderma leucocontextum]|nr:hypothetical protein LXA43DRAFT_1104889 [Ganoderma leucocontextum]
MTNFGQSPPGDGEGPCWIILGGPEGNLGIVMDQRPANTALGRFPSLLPIVVVTKTYADALVEEISELLTGYEKFYAIRVGKETGIWVNYAWDEIVHLKKFADAKFKGHATLQDALLWMIEKAPHNRAQKKAYTPSGSPVKLPSSAPDPSSRPLPPPPVFADESHTGCSPSKADQVARVLTTPMRSLSVSLPTGLQLLQAVIRPLASQLPAVAGCSAFNMGSRADAFFRGRDADDTAILKVLRARLYAHSRVEFAHFLSVELNWKESDSNELWKLIDLPDI